MTPEQLRSHNAVEAALNHVKKDIPQPKQLTPEQQCLERANKVMNNVAQRFARELQARLVRPEYHECVEQLYPIIRQEFSTWTKDEFATLACMHLAITATQALKDNFLI